MFWPKAFVVVVVFDHRHRETPALIPVDSLLVNSFPSSCSVLRFQNTRILRGRGPNRLCATLSQVPTCGHCTGPRSTVAPVNLVLIPPWFSSSCFHPALTHTDASDFTAVEVLNTLNLYIFFSAPCASRVRLRVLHAE